MVTFVYPRVDVKNNNEYSLFKNDTDYKCHDFGYVTLRSDANSNSFKQSIPLSTTITKLGLGIAVSGSKILVDETNASKVKAAGQSNCLAELLTVLSCTYKCKFNDNAKVWCTGSFTKDGDLVSNLDPGTFNAKLANFINDIGAQYFIVPANNVRDLDEVTKEDFDFYEIHGLPEAPETLNEIPADISYLFSKRKVVIGVWPNPKALRNLVEYIYKIPSLNSSTYKYKSPQSSQLTENYLYCPKTFITREPASKELAEKFINTNNKIIIVQAPYGYGKTTLIRQALVQHDSILPHYAFEIGNISGDRFIELLLNVLSINKSPLDEREPKLDQFQLFIPDIRQAVENADNALLIFYNSIITSKGDNLPFPSDIWKCILKLATSGIRCVVELWSTPDDFGRIPNPTRFYHNKFEALSSDEVDKLLSLSDLNGADMLNEFLKLGGHPFYITSTIERLINNRELGLNVSSEQVLPSARITREEDKQYLDWVEAKVSGTAESLDPFIIQWSAWLQEIPFPLELCNSVQSEQILQLQKLGLVVGSVDFSPQATKWFSFVSENHYMKDNQLLAITGSHFEPLPVELLPKVKRNLIEAASKHDQTLKTKILYLLNQIDEIFPEKCLSGELDLFPFLSPCSEQACNVLIDYVNESEIEINNISNELFLLEQLCRNARWDDAQILWMKILNAQRLSDLIEYLNHNWLSIRSVGLSLLYTQIHYPLPVEKLVVLSKTLSGINIVGEGYGFYMANFTLILAHAFARLGNHTEANNLLPLAIKCIDYLPSSEPPDQKYFNKKFLEYSCLRVEQMTSESIIRSIQLVESVHNLCRSVLSIKPNDFTLQRGYLHSLADISRLNNGSVIQFENEMPLLNKIIDSPVLQQIIMSSHWMKREEYNSQDVYRRLLYACAKHDCEIHKQLKFSELPVFTKVCAILIHDHDMIDTATQLIWEYCHSTDDISQEDENDYLLQITALIKISLGDGLDDDVYGTRISVSDPVHIIETAVKTSRRTHDFKEIADYLVNKTGKIHDFKEIANYLRAVIKQVLSPVYLFRIKCLTSAVLEPFIVSCIRFYLDEFSRDHLPKHEEVEKLVNLALERDDIKLRTIARLQIDYERRIWQHSLQEARNQNIALPDFDHIKLLNNYKFRLQKEEFWLVKAQAETMKYIWRHDDALMLAQDALKLATNFNDKINVLSFIVSLLLTQVFTPEILRTSFTPAPNEEKLKLLLKYESEYLTIFPDSDMKMFFLDSLENYNDPSFWSQACDIIEAKLGSPLSDIWNKKDGYSEEMDINRQLFITNKRLIDFRHPLLWASDNVQLPLEIRRRLADYAVRCSYAAMKWQEGASPWINMKRGLSSILAKNAVASSILVSWNLHRETSAFRIWGETCSDTPIKNNTGYLEWPELCLSLFENKLTDPNSVKGLYFEHNKELLTTQVYRLYREYQIGASARRYACKKMQNKYSKSISN